MLLKSNKFNFFFFTFMLKFKKKKKKKKKKAMYIVKIFYYCLTDIELAGFNLGLKHLGGLATLKRCDTTKQSL